ncbi:required for respiratory growth protein 9, mitochondrial [Corynespora cassiicola Philippines]|uniref:Required for respiratory growth protein 9, mitochondrial n=1 Tax=Corynespora cassiicola Philippines TaxID=1448308 RepID=A0A2T2NDK7_CORCC|nr:required for respiratory growth protein 9, mitochondrial [Corynespora cassiicola Philippines]
MPCTVCSRTTLNSFIRSLVSLEPAIIHPFSAQRAHPSRFFSVARALQKSPLEPPKRASTNRPSLPPSSSEETGETSKTSAPHVGRSKKKEPWQIQKEAIRKKLDGQAWNPRKKLSPDTMEGIRHLHKTQPEKFTTPILAQHFKLSSEAIRRILRSKWRPTDEEQEERMRRWDKRGEKIWSNLVELGVKPPKKWRDMGVGKAREGQVPKWKSRKRNTVVVHDNPDDINDVEDEPIIPIVHSTHAETAHWRSAPLSQRIRDL